MCACRKKTKGNKPISENRLLSVSFRVGISMYKSIMLSIPYTNIASSIDANSISGSKIIGRALREQEDTTEVSFEFVTQIILSVLLRKLAMVTTNLHCRPHFHS